jgi:hypothetical protein
MCCAYRDSPSRLALMRTLLLLPQLDDSDYQPSVESYPSSTGGHTDDGSDADNGNDSDSISDLDEPGDMPRDFYDGDPHPETPSFEGLELGDRDSVVKIVERWAQSHGFKVVQGGGHGTRKFIFVCQCKGRKAPQHIIMQLQNADAKRRKASSYCLPGEQPCPFRMNVNFSNEGWHVTKFEHVHEGHSALPRTAMDYACRLASLTNEQGDWIRLAAGTGIDPQDVLNLFREFHPDAPPINRKDLRNLITIRRAGSDEAHALLKMLLDLKAKDPDWYIEWSLNEKNELTHLFWMSPEQRQNARDQPQILIHDNTYKTNKFGLPLGVFSGVSRCGHRLFCCTFYSCSL